jgi:hypothetical protein
MRNKKAQEEKISGRNLSNLSKKIGQEKDLPKNKTIQLTFSGNKKAQEEMVGFALIMIVVSVILVIFLSFYLRDTGRGSLQSYEVSSFLGAVMQYTTECEDNFGVLELDRLILACDKEESCLDGKSSCDVLNSTASEIIKESWQIGEDRPIKGYSFIVDSEQKKILDLSEGNITKNFQGYPERIARGAKDFNITLIIYS